MPDARATGRATRAPWIVAAVAGVVFVVLLIIFLKPLSDARASSAPGQLTTREQRAVTAASAEVVNVLTIRRAHFDADYGRAIDGATGSFLQDLKSREATYKKALTQGKFDTSAQVVNQALVGSQGNKFIVLIVVNGYQSTTPSTPVPSHLEITMQLVKGKYLASDFTPIEVS